MGIGIGIGVSWPTIKSLALSLISKLRARADYFENKKGTEVILGNLENCQDPPSTENLLEKASIVTTPTAYENGKLLSVKPSVNYGSDFFNPTPFGISTITQNPDGSYTLVNSGTGGRGFVQSLNLEKGKEYVVDYNVVSTNATIGVFTTWKGSGYSNDYFGDATTINSGTFRFKTSVTQSGDIRFNNLNIGATITFFLTIRESTVGDFDFSRGSSATRVNSQGLIEDVQIIGGELVQNGGFDTDSDWSKGTGWSIANGKANCDGTQTSNTDMNQSGLSFTANKTYKLSIDVEVIQGKISYISYIPTGIFEINNITSSGSYVFYNTLIANAGSLRIRGSSDFIGSIDNVSVKEITDDTDLPRIDYTDGVGNILLEPQSTNGVNYSEDFTQYNRINDSTVTSNDIISPDGTQNASKLTITAGTPYFAPSHSGFTSGTVYTMSCFVKKGTNRWVRLANQTSPTTGAWFDLDNNVVGTTKAAVISATITNYGNGWYRISSTLTAQNTHTDNFLGLSDNDDSINATAEDIGNTVYFWGFQIQEQSVLTSYIPTVGSTVTRLGETLNNSGNADLFNNSEGVLYFETAALTDESYITRRISINDGTNDNQVTIYYHPNTTNQVVPRIYAGGASVWAQDTNIYNIYGRTNSEFNKFAIRYGSNGIQFFFNGVLSRSSTSVPNFTNPLNNLSFDNGEGIYNFEGNVKCVAVFKEALTDEELACLTSYTIEDALHSIDSRAAQKSFNFFKFSDFKTRLKKLF